MLYKLLVSSSQPRNFEILPTLATLQSIKLHKSYFLILMYSVTMCQWYVNGTMKKCETIHSTHCRLPPIHCHLPLIKEPLVPYLSSGLLKPLDPTPHSTTILLRLRTTFPPTISFFYTNTTLFPASPILHPTHNSASSPPSKL